MIKELPQEFRREQLIFQLRWWRRLLENWSVETSLSSFAQRTKPDSYSAQISISNLQWFLQAFHFAYK